jgi:hypothetical protein
MEDGSRAHPGQGGGVGGRCSRGRRLPDSRGYVRLRPGLRPSAQSGYQDAVFPSHRSGLVGRRCQFAHLYDSGPVYDYAVNMAVNPQRIPGKVSGIFLHVTDGNPTWGCVAIGREEMKSILTWLDPAADPRITVGVGTPSLVAAKSS